MKVKESVGGQTAESSVTVMTAQAVNEDNMGPLSCECQLVGQDLEKESPALNGAGKKSKMVAEQQDEGKVSKEMQSSGHMSPKTVTQDEQTNHGDTTTRETEKDDKKEKKGDSKVMKERSLNIEKLVADMQNVNIGKDEVQKVTENLKDMSLTPESKRTEQGVTNESGEVSKGSLSPETTQSLKERELKDESEEGKRVCRGPGVASAYTSHPTGQQYQVKGYYPAPGSTDQQFGSLLGTPALPNYAHLEGNFEWHSGKKKRGADDEYINMSKGFRTHQAYNNLPVENEDFMSGASTASMSRLSGGSVVYNQPPNRLSHPGPRTDFTHQDLLHSDSSQDSEPCVDLDDFLKSVTEPIATERELMQNGYQNQNNNFRANNLNYQSPVPASHYSQDNMNITAEKGDSFARPSCMYENQNNVPPMPAVPSTVFHQDVLPSSGNLHSSPVGSLSSVTSGNNMSPYMAQSPGYQQANSPVASYHPVPSPQDGASGQSFTAPSPASVRSQRSSLQSIPSPAMSTYSVPSPGSVPSPPQPGAPAQPIHQVYSPPQHQGGSPYQNGGGSPGNYSSCSAYSPASSGYTSIGPLPPYPPVASPDYSLMSPQSVQSMPSPATSQRHTSTSSTPPPETDNNSNTLWDDLENFIEHDVKEMEEEKNRRNQRSNSSESSVPCSVSSATPATAPVPTSVSQQQFVIIPPTSGPVPTAKRGNTAKSTSSAPLTTTIVVPSATAGTQPMILVMSPPRPDPNRLRPILPKPDPSKNSSKGNASKTGSKVSSTGGSTHAGPPQNGGIPKSGVNRPTSASRKIAAMPPQCSPPAMLPQDYPEQELYQARRQVSELQHDTLLARDEEGDGLIHMVVVKRKEVYLKALLERLHRNSMLETVNQVNNLSQTPVYLATRTNEPIMLHMLLMHGGDPNRQARLNSCTTGGHLQMRAPIHYPASCGDDCLETLEVLLHCPILDINQMSTEGMTALHYAAAKHGETNQETGNKIDSTRVIMRLIQFGGDLDKKDGKSGKTPIHYIIETKDLELIRTVFNLVPADHLSQMLKTQTFDGNTSLHIAASLHMSNIEEHKRLIRILKQNGGDVSIQNGEKKAAKSMVPDNKKEIVDILKVKGQEESKAKRNSNVNNTHHQNTATMAGTQPLYIFGTVQSSPMTLVPGAAPAQVTSIHPHMMPSMPPLQPPAMPQPVLNMPGSQ